MGPLRRPPKSAAEIDVLPPLGSTQCVAHIREHGHSFAPETLVYLIREAALQKDTTLVDLCARLLLGQEGRAGRWEGGHCEPTIAKLARQYRFYADLNLRLAFRSGCLGKLAEALHAGREEKHYWEERFGDAFKKACIDVARSLSRSRNRDMEAGVTDEGDDVVEVDGFDPGIELVDAAILERMAAPHHWNTLLNAIRNLPRRQSQAAFLAWVEGYPIEGKGEGTVAATMGGIDPRAVYKHLEKAKATLSANPDLRAIWFGEV